jgi:Uma2 family endonuclease
MAVATHEPPPQTHVAPVVPPEFPRYRFSAEKYHQLAESGILAARGRVELIDGELILMSPIGPPHFGNVARLNSLLAVGLAGRAIVHVQGPVRLNDFSEPQPDLTLLKPRADFYATCFPAPEDVLLIIEVMDTSAGYDRGVKVKLYAAAGIAEVWLVDLNLESVEVYRRPSGGQYTEVRIRKRGESVSPEAFPDFILTVDAILG